MLKKKLKIVGALRETEGFGPQQIRSTILKGVKALSLNSDFTGRPKTHIYASDHEVVKIRRDLRLTARQAIPWLDKVMEKERRLGVHHPSKTWFYIYQEKGGEGLLDEEVLIGNITPRLRPLHKRLEPVPADEQARSENGRILADMFEMYLQTARTFGIKLDEGLSNFALDSEGQLYYVDDELYSWDKFISFSMMLGVMVRRLDWLDRDFARVLAQGLGEQLDRVFGDLNYRASVAYQLRSAFMPAGKKRDIANLMCAVLTSQATGEVWAESTEDARLGPARAMSEASAPSEPAAEVAGIAVSGGLPDPEAPLAVLADVHANLPALEVVLDWLEREGIRQGVVLGDLVGYGPDAVAVVDRFRDSGFQIIKGNHDHSVALGIFERGLSKNARQVAEWTHTALSDEQREWLKQLPPVLDTEQWMAVHGAPLDPEFFYGYVYEMTYRDNLDKLVQLQRRLCFHGHSHMPGLYGRDAAGQDRHRVGEQVALDEFEYCLVCPGSVGQSRNGVPMAQFAIYEPAEDRISFKALAYDFEPVVQRMKAEGFPADLYRRLAKGV
ncbi:metallophosphoesterase family protein [Marinobacterium marinum]|uniref:Metallophosphoesterase n=1 Tax=Marinobacterium marinum TaxID=2756129 RepID=A0A7W2ADG7_9GAMM|nr:metallophosphoesterase family protein [Marinobacterium marinum]MBA4503173.1 metallophosphoesterase [Marinobacterium marinum]